MYNLTFNFIDNLKTNLPYAHGTSASFHNRLCSIRDKLCT